MQMKYNRYSYRIVEISENNTFFYFFHSSWPLLRLNLANAMSTLSFIHTLLSTNSSAYYLFNAQPLCSPNSLHYYKSNTNTLLSNLIEWQTYCLLTSLDNHLLSPTSLLRNSCLSINSLFKKLFSPYLIGQPPLTPNLFATQTLCLLVYNLFTQQPFFP